MTLTAQDVKRAATITGDTIAPAADVLGTDATADLLLQVIDAQAVDSTVLDADVGVISEDIDWKYAYA